MAWEIPGSGPGLGYPAGLDPFESIPNPAFYVPRAAAERALLDLEEALWRGARALILRGPAGIGRTMLMRVLEQRLGPEYRSLAVPYGALPPSEFFELVSSLLDQDPGGDPAQAVLRLATRLGERSGPLVLLVQDADALPDATAQRLGELLEHAGGSLRLVARCGADGAARLRDALGTSVEEVFFDTPMSEEETDRYVRARLGLARVDSPLRLRFHGGTLTELHERSAGLPAVVNGLCRAVGSAAPPAWARPEAIAPELGPAAGDPFGPAVEPDAYTPRAQTEALLEEVETALRGEAAAVCIEGPPGIGKSMILQVLEKRLADGFQTVPLPYSALPADEFWTFVLSRLGSPLDDDPRSATLGVARQFAAAGSCLVLLIDEAHSLPEDTQRDIGRILRAGEGNLRAVVCAPEGEAPRFTGCETVHLRFDGAMNPDETAAYVQSRLERYDAPSDVRRRFDGATLASLHSASGGNPREVHRLAGRIEGGTHALAELLRPTSRRAPLAAHPTMAPPPPTRQAREPAPPPPRSKAPPQKPATVAQTAAVAPEHPIEDVPGKPIAKPPPRIRRRGVLAAAAAFGVALGLLLAPGTLWEAPPRPVIEAVSPLAPPLPPILVHINATPWARIEIDGETIGETPLGNVPLAPGMHRVVAQLPDGSVIEREVDVSPGQRHIAF